MKIQSKRNANIKATINYVCQEKKKATVIACSSDVSPPLDFNDKTQMRFAVLTMKENIQAVEKLHKAYKEPVGHHILCFNPQDSITTEKELIIVQSYIKDRGLDSTKWLAVKHSDTANPHIHIVFSRVDNNLRLLHENDYKKNTLLANKYCQEFKLTLDIGLTTEVERVKKGERRSKGQILEQIEKLKEQLPQNLREIKNLYHLKKLCQQHGYQYMEQGTTIQIDSRKYKKEDIKKIGEYNRNLAGRGNKNSYYEYKNNRIPIDEKSKSIRNLLPIALHVAKDEHHLKKLSEPLNINVQDVGTQLIIDGVNFDKIHLEQIYDENKKSKKSMPTVKPHVMIENNVLELLPEQLRKARNEHHLRKLSEPLHINIQDLGTQLAIDGVKFDKTFLETIYYNNRNNIQEKALEEPQISLFQNGSEEAIDQYLKSHRNIPDIMTELNSAAINDTQMRVIVHSLDKNFDFEKDDVYEQFYSYKEDNSNRQSYHFENFFKLLESLPNIMNREEENKKRKKRMRIR